jgi:hypothetical protein
MVVSAVQDDRAGWDGLCRSPFLPSGTEEDQLCLAECQVHSDPATSRASNDDLGLISIELGLRGPQGEIEVIVIEFGVADLAAVLLEIGRLDAARDTLPAVQKEKFHVSRRPPLPGARLIGMDIVPVSCLTKDLPFGEKLTC